MAIKFPQSRRSKWLLRLGIALVLYTLLGFFAVPAIIKSQMLKRLPALTKRKATIEQVKFNPYALSLTIRGLALKETNGDVFSSFDEFYANFQPWASLFKRSWVFAEISLQKPFAQVVYEPDGSFNFANLLGTTNVAPPPLQKSDAPKPLPSVTIYSLTVSNGNFAFADLKRKEPFRTQFIPINVSLSNLTTIRDRNSPYLFIARTDAGESFAWSGTISINPLRSAGTFRLGGLQLKKYATYGHDYAKFDILNGIVDVATDYSYDSTTNALNASISNAMFSLTSLELKAPDTGETVISIPSFFVTNVSANVLERTAHIGLVKSSAGSLILRQNHDGMLNLLALLDLPKKSPVEITTNSVAITNALTTPFNAKIDEVAFDNYTFKVEDKKPEHPANFTIDQFNLYLKNISNQTNSPIDASLGLRFQESGNFNVTGKVNLMPMSADLELRATNLDLRPFQPYAQEQVKLAISSGTLSIDGKTHFAMADAKPQLDFTGAISVNKFATADDVLFKDFVKFDALNVNGIDFTLQPQKLHVAQVKFDGLRTSLVIGPDHRANLQTILRLPTNALPVSPNSNSVASKPLPVIQANPSKVPLPDMALDELALQNTSLHFEDQSVEPHCAFDLQELGGTIRGLSSQSNTTAVVDLKGKVDSHSPFSISGKIQPLASELFADVTVAFTNTELTAFTPYTEKFAGRPLQKGKLSLTVHYNIDKKALKAENGFYLDQFTLGAKNGNTNATSLPVKLAVALLKDRKGRIELNVPLSGRLDDPKFKVTPLIWQVVRNIMIKAAASPFSLLGSMFGGGPELSFVNFAPGNAAIPDAETNKLEILTKALFERPELSLEMNGTVDPDLDRAPLAQMKLEQQLKSLWVKRQTADGKSAISLDDVQLKPEERERMVQSLYKTEIGSYEPTLPDTHQLAAAGQTNVSPADLANANMLRLIAQNTDDQHGAARLLPSKNKTAVVTPIAASHSSVAKKSPEHLSVKEAKVEDMESQLLKKITVTEDDFRELMKQRAAQVQTYLLKSQKIAADRLFIIAPKPLSAMVKGEDRVNLTLD